MNSLVRERCAIYTRSSFRVKKEGTSNACWNDKWVSLQKKNHVGKNHLQLMGKKDSRSTRSPAVGDIAINDNHHNRKPPLTNRKATFSGQRIFNPTGLYSLVFDSSIFCFNRRISCNEYVLSQNMIPPITPYCSPWCNATSRRDLTAAA